VSKVSAPLLDECGGREDERAADESTHRQLLEDDPCLDRLPEPHLVGQDGAPAEGTPEDALGDVDLVRELLDRVRVEGDEAIEAGDERDALGVTTELEPVARGSRPGDRLGKRGQGLLVDRPEVGRVRRGGHASETSRWSRPSPPGVSVLTPRR
jgi:hypothetical protein